MLDCLTLVETGTYTGWMTGRGQSLLAASGGRRGRPRLAWSRVPALVAQAIQRSMYVSVVDEAGAPVPDLGPSDFVVREDNVAREVLRVGPATEPMQIARARGHQPGGAREHRAHRTALPPFVTALINANATGAKNQVAIIAFGERPTIITDYTSSLTELEKGINRIWALDDSGAYLLDAIVEVCQGFKKREARRPVIVAIAQEGPEFSYRHYDQVLEPLRESGAPFHVLVLGTPTTSLSDEARSRNIVLDEGTRGTGGIREQLLTRMALAGKLKQLATELTHQYRVTYARPESLIPPERVTVSAKAPG